MSPIHCKDCRELVGVRHPLSSMRYERPCPGKGNHQKPTRKIGSPRFFRTIQTEVITYPETGTRSFIQNYVGPKNRFVLKLVLIFGPVSECFIGDQMVTSNRLSIFPPHLHWN
jgi:hypothetical protein